jgi:hypothetical protein
MVNLRDKHDCLNYLTITQIVYLREKLTTFNLLQAQSNQKKQQDTFDAKDMTQIKSFLASINKSLTPKLIIKANQSKVSATK